MTDTRAITCCFTGHRQIPKVEYPAVRARLTYAIRDLYEKGYRRFVAGGAIGFDTLAAEIVLALRRHYPDVSLILMLPCADQDARWSSEDKAIYQKQKGEADEVILLAERYFDGCMQKRNRYMVDHASLLIAVHDGQSGGTRRTIEYAMRRGLDIVDIPPEG